MILRKKDLKDQILEADMETSRLESEEAKLTRTGRQPLNKSGKGPRREKVEKVKKDKGRKKSFDLDKDDEGTANSSMFVPEDDCDTGKGGRSTEVDTEYTGAISPQTRDTVLEQTRLMQ